MLARQFTVERFTGIDAITSAAPVWRKLADSRSRNQPFSSPGFAIAALKAFHLNDRPELWVVREGDHTHAVFVIVARPLSRLAINIREAGFPRNPHFILNDPLLGEQLETECAIRAFLGAWGREADHTLMLDHLPTEGGVAESVARIAIEAGFGVDPATSSRDLFHIEVSGTYDEYLSTRSGDHRWQLKKIARRAAAAGATIEILRTRDEISAALPIYFDIERRSWQGSTPATAMSEADRQFAYQLLGDLEDKEVGELLLLCVDGTPAAGLRMLGGPGKTCVHTMHFDQRYKALSPGNLLLDRMLRLSFERGLREVDLHGGSPFFARWATSFRSHGSVRLYKPGLVGKLLRHGRSRLGQMTDAASRVKVPWRRGT